LQIKISCLKDDDNKSNELMKSFIKPFDFITSFISFFHSNKQKWLRLSHFSENSPFDKKLNINTHGLVIHKATYLIEEKLCALRIGYAWMLNATFPPPAPEKSPLSSAQPSAAHALTGCLLLISRSERRLGRLLGGRKKAALSSNFIQ
jgi:hypothetical protein